MMKRKPLIGITPDSETPLPDGKGNFSAGVFATSSYYALRHNYIDVISHAGGVCIMLPYILEEVDHFADILDGVVLTGGGFDIDPRLFGAKDVHETVKTKPARTDFEMALTRKMIEKGKPLLGICGGMQLLNVIYGGTLIQDISTFVEAPLPHKQLPPFDKAAHPVILEKNSLLAKLAGGQTRIEVNTSHHQAIEKVAQEFLVTGKAQDGIIEAIEHANYSSFCVGVQWHPEYYSSPVDRGLYESFIEACMNTM